MHSSVVIGIQCRLSSTRLPGKALLRLGGYSVLGFLVRRAINSGFPVYVLTSNQSEDDLIEKEALREGVTGVIRGPVNNVIERYKMLVHHASCDYVVRVTADNPLTEFNFVQPLVDSLLQTKYAGYASVDFARCPEGLNLEVIRAASLLQSAKADSSDCNREHVTPWLRSQAGSVLHFWDPSLIGSCAEQLCRYSFTIDRLSDYIKVAKLVEFSAEVKKFSLFSGQYVCDTISCVLDGLSVYPVGRTHVLK